jgi:hypothetical protein
MTKNMIKAIILKINKLTTATPQYSTITDKTYSP